MASVALLLTPIAVANPTPVRSSPRTPGAKGLSMTKRTPSTIVTKGLSTTARPQPSETDLALDIGRLLDFGLLSKGVLQRVLTMAKELTIERSNNAQLVRDNAALKAKLSCTQSSLAQAEQANAASVDTILQLQAEVSSAIHMERLCQGNEFLAVRKEARDLSIHLGDVTTELRKVTAERDYFKEEALGNALTSIYDTPFTPIRFDG